MLIRVIDFETTGVPSETQSQAICEIGWCDVRTYDNGDPPEAGDPCSLLCNPGRPMPADAQAAHHISDVDVADAVGPTEGLRALTANAPDVWCAHNAKFEQEFFSGAGKPWICTRKVAMRLWPKSPNHQNQTLRYALGVVLDGALAMPPHRAGPDAYVTAHILLEALRVVAVEQLIEWTEKPALLPSVTFGKHKGREWSQLPWDYLDWIVRKSDMDEDVKFTARHYIQQLEARHAS